MLRINWTHKTIESNQDAEAMRQLFRATAHTAAAFDTETDGLNIIRCKPFLFQFGWYTKESMQGWTFVVDLEAHPKLARQVIKVWHALVKTVPKYLATNTKYDLHMLTNIELPYEGENISDLQAWIRLGTDAIPERHGGAPLALKKFATRYIDQHAADHEKKIDAERTAIAKELNLKLRKRLGWKQKQIDDFFKDKLHDADDLPEQERIAWFAWHDEDLPEYLKPIVTGSVDSEMITYNTLNRATVIEYGHLDIVWVLEAYHILEEAVRVRENLDAIAMEEANIYPVFDMERVGFEVDVEYVLQCKQKLKTYILQRRRDMQRIAGCDLSIGQHALIKQILVRLGCPVESTGSEELDNLLIDLKAQGGKESAVEFIEVLQELRTLEKWYSTYIIKFITELKFSNKLYTQINLEGAVSLRVTSDFQQFPSDGIQTLEGEELFHPRKMFKVSEGYKGTVYLDYSQIELRLQAMYTILVNGGDVNLCRAYMPFQCYLPIFNNRHELVRREQFDYTNPNHIRQAYTLTWLKNEDGEQWTAVDVHAATTEKAFPNVDKHTDEFKWLRKHVGKRVNFAKNYGAQFKKIKTMFPKFDDATVHMIDEAYYKAFPGVKAYHDYCYAIANRQAYAQNLFGVKYYNASGHKLINMLVQGTGACVLKHVIPKIHKHLKDHGYKSKFQMQIHDELSFLWHPDDPAELFFEIKAIMEDFPDFLVPIVADMEVTTTTWAAKKEVETIDELKAA